MTYFSKTPLLRYPIGDYLAAIKDITFKIKFKEKVLNNVLFYDYYQIKDTDTPEFLSHMIYDTPFYHWIVLIANDMVDPYMDWPKPNAIFEEWIEELCADLPYGPDTTKYWVDDLGVVVYLSVFDYNTHELTGTLPAGYYPVSYRLYEETLNNQKRFIRLIKKDVIGEVVKQFEQLMVSI